MDLQSNTQPIIGISGSIETDESKQFILRDYCTAILTAGGIPVLLSVDVPAEQLEGLLGALDGVMLAGGCDADPALYGEWPRPSLGEVTPLRDRFELPLIKACWQQRMPVLGICRGVQVMNIALGGSLYQHLPTDHEAATGKPALLHGQTSPAHYVSHTVDIAPGTLLSSILSDFTKASSSIATSTIAVNSFHHQAVKQAAAALAASAFAPDGVIEALEDPSHPFFLGVQWHPERMHKQDLAAQAIFAAFTKAASQYHLQKGEKNK